VEFAGAVASGTAVPWRTVGAVALTFVLTTAALIWAVQPGELVTVPVDQGTGPLAALVRADSPAPVTPDRVPAVMPFVESDVEGRQAYQRGEFDAALARFEDEISRHPTDASSHSNAGQVLIRMGRPAEALPYLAKAVALDPERWTYRFNLGRGHGAVGDWGLAAAEYQEAARLFPGDHATVFNLAQALHRAGREDDAVARYREAIELKPDDASFHLALGISEEKRGVVAEAITAYRKFLEMDPEAKEAQGVKARIERLEKAAAAAPASAPAPADR